MHGSMRGGWRGGEPTARRPGHRRETAGERAPAWRGTAGPVAYSTPGRPTTSSQFGRRPLGFAPLPADHILITIRLRELACAAADPRLMAVRAPGRQPEPTPAPRR